ncbi:hypothetical protein ACFS5N_10685 [Mucilaginibacter ximonensis]|uniref:Galectin n=1 Tax=Mucilaginibacter ximonensis TaxID=538021 RepID=A0ABW5YCC4_9SPHI
MISLRYNFKHPFKGNVILRKTGFAQGWRQTMSFDSGSENDFDIHLQVNEDGDYQVILNWEFEGRSFSHESDITVKNGQLIF